MSQAGLLCLEVEQVASLFDALLLPPLSDEAGTGLNDEGCGVLCAIVSGLSIAPADQIPVYAPSIGTKSEFIDWWDNVSPPNSPAVDEPAAEDEPASTPVPKLSASPVPPLNLSLLSNSADKPPVLSLDEDSSAVSNELQLLSKALLRTEGAIGSLEEEIVLVKEAEESWKQKAGSTEQQADSAGDAAEMQKMLEQLKTQKAEAETNVEFEFTERRKWEDKAEELEKELAKAQAAGGTVDSAGDAAEMQKMLEQLKTQKAEAETNVEFEFTERRKWEDKAEELEKEVATLKIIVKAQADGNSGVEASAAAPDPAVSKLPTDDTGLFAAIDKASENQRHIELQMHATAAADVTAANARAVELQAALADSLAAAAADAAASLAKQMELEAALVAKQELLRVTEVELSTLKEVLVDADSDEDSAPTEKPIAASPVAKIATRARGISKKPATAGPASLLRQSAVPSSPSKSSGLKPSVSSGLKPSSRRPAASAGMPRATKPAASASRIGSSSRPSALNGPKSTASAVKPGASRTSRPASSVSKPSGSMTARGPAAKPTVAAPPRAQAGSLTKLAPKSSSGLKSKSSEAGGNAAAAAATSGLKKPVANALRKPTVFSRSGFGFAPKR